MVKRKRTIATELRKAIKSSGETYYRLAQESGVAQEQISRFVRGERDLRLETAGKLAAALDLRLTQSER